MVTTWMVYWGNFGWTSDIFQPCKEWRIKQAINQARRQDFNIALIWWGSLRLVPILNSWYYPQDIFNNILFPNYAISLLWLDSSLCKEVVSFAVKHPALGVSNCDILRLSWFWKITYHDCGNNHDYIILTIFDVKSMQQVMFYKRFMVNILWVITYYYPTTRKVMM